MPESPEIEFQRYYIEKHFNNKILTNISILWGRYKKHGPPNNFKEFKRNLPLRCIDVRKKGKVLFIHFENGWCIISKLGMSGWWYVVGDKPKWKPVTRNVVCSFQGEKDFIFSDFRNFGTLTFTRDKSVIQNEIMKLAPDIIDNSTHYPEIRQRIHRLSIAVKEKLLEDVLVDQKLVISGIGNYLKSEVLYDARISPLRKVKDIKDFEWKTIFMSAKKISKLMYKVLLKQIPELYIGAMQVYHKDKDPLGFNVQKHQTKMGRTTFWVPELQH